MTHNFRLRHFYLSEKKKIYSYIRYNTFKNYSKIWRDYPDFFLFLVYLILFSYIVSKYLINNLRLNM